MVGFLWSSVLTIMVGLLACWIISRRLPRQYHGLADTFVAYLVLVVVFAFAYSSLYQNDHNRFAFNEDIVQVRKGEVMATEEVARMRVLKRIQALQQLAAVLATWKGPVPVDPGVTDIVRLKTATYEFEFELTYLWTPSPNGRLYCTNPLHVYKPCVLGTLPNTANIYTLPHTLLPCCLALVQPDATRGRMSACPQKQ